VLGRTKPGRAAPTAAGRTEHRVDPGRSEHLDARCEERRRDLRRLRPDDQGRTADVFERVRGPVLAVERVAVEDVSSYGIVAVDESEDLGRGVYRVTDLVEKPRREEAPSNLAIIGRYILTPDIFGALEATSSDRAGEIQLTNGLRRLLRERPVYVCEIDGVRHDTGNKLGFLKAIVYFALRRPDLAEPFRRYLESLDLKIGVGS